MNLKQRLEELERRFHGGDPIALTMPDGSTETLRLRHDQDLLDVFNRSMRELNAGAGFSPDVDLIRRSVYGTEKGGHMIELCRALLNGPSAPEELDAVG